jgi:hypothetical protein
MQQPDPTALGTRPGSLDNVPLTARRAASLAASIVRVGVGSHVVEARGKLNLADCVGPKAGVILVVDGNGSLFSMTAGHPCSG